MTPRFVTRAIRGTLYDYPHYYDLAFGTGSSAECDFLEACFARHADRPVQRVFEPACGSGRLLVRLAKRGFQVLGWDLNRASVLYCNGRFKKRGLPDAAVVGDIAQISLPSKVDAAFNMISSFQLLPTERAAECHLRSLGANVAKGGLYILGLHLMPSSGKVIKSERTAATRGKVSVVCDIRTTHVNARRREVRCRMVSAIRTPRTRTRISEELRFRMYSASQIQRLFDKVAVFEPVATYDFRYDLMNPISVGPATQDVVYVLRRR
jgi:SAM-dependent methyltransferase